MNSSRSKRNYENLEKRIYTGVGEYGIPELAPVAYEKDCEFIPFNYASSTKDREKKGVHFFVDDYQFHRLWANIDFYIGMLRQFQYVMTPDFSTYADFPKVMQLYNHYRKHWIGAYLQEQGILVIPTISWSDEQSYEWCFDGEPTQGTVSVSAVGTQMNKQAKRLFMEGYREMMKRLQPETIIFYGTVPDGCTGNIIQLKSFQEKFRGAV
ncbi:MAG: DUF4417 domain-containing protein [Lachnospiraceae bacterium]|nr:DUF4417 domain-containing protein [Lachnospiraceae bacterium]